VMSSDLIRNSGGFALTFPLSFFLSYIIIFPQRETQPVGFSSDFDGSSVPPSKAKY